jgi:hypothetical protein
MEPQQGYLVGALNKHSHLRTQLTLLRVIPALSSQKLAKVRRMIHSRASLLNIRALYSQGELDMFKPFLPDVPP